MQSGEQAKRPWAIRRWCLKLSIVLATIAEVAFIVTDVVMIASRNRILAVMALALAWPAYYGIVLAIAYGIAQIDQQGSFTEQSSERYSGLFPKPARASLDTWYTISPNIALLAFPLMAILMSCLILWCAATGQLHW